MKSLFLIALILPLAMATSKVMEMQVKTGKWPGAGIEFDGHLSFTLCFGENQTHFIYDVINSYQLHKTFPIGKTLKNSSVIWFSHWISVFLFDKSISFLLFTFSHFYVLGLFYPFYCWTFPSLLYMEFSTNFYFELFKGGFISEGILNLDTMPTKGSKSCPWAEN